MRVRAELRRARSVLHRAWEIKESLRELCKLDDPAAARAHLDAWLARACRSRIPPSSSCPGLSAPTARASSPPSSSACPTPSSKANSKIRLINHRGYGHHSATALNAMLSLCAGGITIQLPTTT